MKDFQKRVRWGMGEVPRFRKGWAYAPLNKLPQTTILLVETEKPNFIEEPRKINNQPEVDVIRLQSGLYTLQIENYPCIKLLPFRNKEVYLKIYHPYLAPDSVIEGNIDFEGTTYRVVSGIISKIILPDSEFNFEKNDSSPYTRKTKYNPIRMNSRGF